MPQPSTTCSSLVVTLAWREENFAVAKEARTLRSPVPSSSARGCVQFDCRFTLSAASAVPKAVVWAAQSGSYVLRPAAPCPDIGAVKTPSDRSLRGKRRHSDGKAATLRSCRADRTVFRGWHSFGTSMRLCSGAGRSYSSHSTSRSPRRREQGAWREQVRVAAIQPQAGIGRRSVLCPPCTQDALANSGRFGW